MRVCYVYIHILKLSNILCVNVSMQWPWQKPPVSGCKGAALRFLFVNLAQLRLCQETTRNNSTPGHTWTILTSQELDMLDHSCETRCGYLYAGSANAICFTSICAIVYNRFEAFPGKTRHHYFLVTNIIFQPAAAALLPQCIA